MYAFEDIVKEGYIRDWLWDYLKQRGEKELPEEAYSYQDGQPPIIEKGKEAEVRACLKDEIQFELFRTGKDYTNNFATVTDAEYDRYYQTMVNGLKEIVVCGQVEGGRVIHLEEVPIFYLQDVPLIEGKWLDRQILELAEWGVLLQSKGYEMTDNGDKPVLATLDWERQVGTKDRPSGATGTSPESLQALTKISRRDQTD